MNSFDGCQMPCLPKMSDGLASFEPQPFTKRFKRLLAKPWNYIVKKMLKKIYFGFTRLQKKMRGEGIKPIENSLAEPGTQTHLQKGDRVRVRSLEEIQTTLNPWKELKGCAFLEDMKKYCGTEQVVLQPMERFLDERDYKVKRSKGIVLLENVICTGTPVFGKCDRCCFLFWREEWLEKI